MGSPDRETVEDVMRDRCGGAQACWHPTPDVDQRNRLPGRLRRQGDAEAETKTGAVSVAGPRNGEYPLWMAPALQGLN